MFPTFEKYFLLSNTNKSKNIRTQYLVLESFWKSRHAPLQCDVRRGINDNSRKRMEPVARCCHFLSSESPFFTGEQHRPPVKVRSGLWLNLRSTYLLMDLDWVVAIDLVSCREVKQLMKYGVNIW